MTKIRSIATGQSVLHVGAFVAPSRGATASGAVLTGASPRRLTEEIASRAASSEASAKTAADCPRWAMGKTGFRMRCLARRPESEARRTWLELRCLAWAGPGGKSVRWSMAPEVLAFQLRNLR